MRRSTLLTVAILGAFVCLLGGTVLFSALQDTARTGTNSAESAALAASADIQLAHATLNAGKVECGLFSENLTSGPFTVTDLNPGFQSGDDFFCIKNVGSQEVTLSALADELTDVDFACTGDEALHGDVTCGGDQAGELSSVLNVRYEAFGEASDEQTGGPLRCSFVGGTTGGLGLKNHATTPHALGTLTPGGAACYSADIGYPTGLDTTAVQTAQSDRVTWRFKFTGQA